MPIYYKSKLVKCIKILNKSIVRMYKYGVLLWEYITTHPMSLSIKIIAVNKVILDNIFSFTKQKIKISIKNNYKFTLNVLEIIKKKIYVKIHNNAHIQVHKAIDLDLISVRSFTKNFVKLLIGSILQIRETYIAKLKGNLRLPFYLVAKENCISKLKGKLRLPFYLVAKENYISKLKGKLRLPHYFTAKEKYIDKLSLFLEFTQKLKAVTSIMVNENVRIKFAFTYKIKDVINKFNDNVSLNRLLQTISVPLNTVFNDVGNLKTTIEANSKINITAKEISKVSLLTDLLVSSNNSLVASTVTLSISTWQEPLVSNDNLFIYQSSEVTQTDNNLLIE